MGIKFWWILVLWVVAGIVAAWLWYRFVRLRKHTLPKHAVAVAHKERLMTLPSYRSLMARYRVYLWILIISLLVSIASAIVLSSRPIAVTRAEPDIHNRDIMLCLDVSGSMSAADYSIIQTFAKLAEGFDGERIGLMVFDSSANRVLPLTNDYETVVARLKQAAIDVRDYTTGATSIFSGVYEGYGSSLVGDGLASCAMGFDNLDIKRSRSIILATDNYANGAQIVDLKQAGALAKDKGIRIYGINPKDLSFGDKESNASQQFRDVVMATDGAYFKIDYDQRDDTSAVEGIIEQISRQEATRYRGVEQLIRTDAPAIPAIALTAGVIAILVLLWRMDL